MEWDTFMFMIVPVAGGLGASGSAGTAEDAAQGAGLGPAPPQSAV